MQVYTVLHLQWWIT